VKIVLDECLDVRIRFQFPEHECVTAQYIKAKGLKDDQLLELIDNNFDVLITVDRSMRFQQNLKKYPRLSTITISGCDGSLAHTLPFLSAIKGALKKMKPGQNIHIP